MPIASRSRIVRAIPIGIDPRDSRAADCHGRSAGGPRADVGGQESQLAALLEFERFDDRHEHKGLTVMNQRDRKIVARVCSLVYECSANKAVAKHLIDRILARF